jgi:hypothetical protein
VVRQEKPLVSDLLKWIRFAAAVLSLVIETAARSQADVTLVVDGGFEDAGFGPWSRTIGTDTISGIVPHSGHGGATLQSSSFYGDPSWRQAVTGLTVGETYTPSFWYINSFNFVGNDDHSMDRSTIAGRCRPPREGIPR